MILTGDEIRLMIEEERIIVDPYDPAMIEPNSCGFRLGDTLIEYADDVIDPDTPPTIVTTTIPEEGLVFRPGRFYLGHTFERIGGVDFASELYANLSTALCGVFIQTSAPLGHTGAVINWTLEITVAQDVRLYPRMRIGKVCFWKNFGDIRSYDGRYVGSVSARESLMRQDGKR